MDFPLAAETKIRIENSNRKYAKTQNGGRAIKTISHPRDENNTYTQPARILPPKKNRALRASPIRAS